VSNKCCSIASLANGDSLVIRAFVQLSGTAPTF